MNNSRALCASTGPTTLAAPCDEKYIDIASPMNAYIGAAVDRYCRLATRTDASSVKILTHRSGKIAMKVPINPTETNEIEPAVSCFSPLQSVLTISIFTHMLAGFSTAILAGYGIGARKPASICVKILMVSTDCSGEKQETAPTFRISMNIARRMRRPRTLGTTRARPENKYHPIT